MMSECLTLYGTAAVAHIAEQPGQTLRAPPSSPEDHAHLDGEVSEIWARLKPLSAKRRKPKKRKKPQRASDLYRAVRRASSKKKIIEPKVVAEIPESRVLPRTRTRLHGDGDKRESKAAAKRFDDKQWGKVDLGDPEEFRWHFAATPNPWLGKHVAPWDRPIFAEHIGWLQRFRDGARFEARRFNLLGKAFDGVRVQALHAAHLVKQISGRQLKPWSGAEPVIHPDGWGQGINPIRTALLRLYGPDPTPAFLQAMKDCGIETATREKIGAGNRLHTFHIVGDPTNTAFGWAILHRCPGAGSFGSRRTGVVHHWHSCPWLFDDTSKQFDEDIERANAGQKLQSAA